MATKNSLLEQFVSNKATGHAIDVLARGPGGGGGGGNNGNGVGGGGGSPGGGTPGGGPGGGKPGGEGFGNNLSVPAIFPALTPTLRGTEGEFTFTTPATKITEPVDPNYVYFAQGVEGNEWQAGNISAGDDDFNVTGPIAIDYVNIGDALESAPIQLGRFVRLELSLFEEIADVTGVTDDTLTGFTMTLLGGSKGGGKPTTKGPTESQGASYLASEWNDTPVSGTVLDPTDPDYDPNVATYDAKYAAVYAGSGSSTEEEKGDSYLKLVIQKVTGLDPQYATDASDLDGDVEGPNDGVDFLTGFGWDGTKWVDTNPDDGITVDPTNYAAGTLFGPELTISGTYNVGVSQSPFKFTEAGNYLITFALDDGTPIAFDADTWVRNDNPDEPGFQPLQLAEGRLTQVVGDGLLGAVMQGDTFVLDPSADTHNGLLALLVGAPSSVGGAGEA